MDINSNNSLILDATDLKLSDTEYTFRENKLIRDYSYEYLCNNQEIDCFIRGDHRNGVKISDGDCSIYYCFGGNRSTSNAASIALGYKLRKNYFFLVEGFTDIYSEDFRVISREICLIDSLYEFNMIKRKLVMYYGQEKNHLNMREEYLLALWEDYKNNFIEALDTNNLNQLRLIKR